LGPTGVGKTELCKTLATFLFDTEDAMVRIDMSEFMEKHSVARLIGAPPGYVGYEQGGYLTEAVRRKPYSVILFDEVEKAHPDVFNILLQVLEDGRLTDSQGRTVDFKNTVIVMTSNMGSDLIQQHSAVTASSDSSTVSEATEAKNYEEMKDMLMDVIGNHFRPEFINRIDEIVVFHPLAKEQIKAIASIQLDRLLQRLKDNGFDVSVTEALLDKLAEAGFDPVFGARPLKRAIQSRIEDPLSKAILSGDLQPGKPISLDIEGEQLKFTS
jgi:ATP-dependent Clp protease ATP-binding subunit ClpB